MEKFNHLVSPLIEEIGAMTAEIEELEEERDTALTTANELGEMLAEAYARIDDLQLSLTGFSKLPAQPVIPIEATIDSILGKSLKEMDESNTLNPGELATLLHVKEVWKAAK